MNPPDASGSVIRKFLRDPGAHLDKQARKYRILAYCCLSTFIVRRLLWLKGVQLGARSIFSGIPLVSRHPGSILSIGDSCAIRSDSYSNLVGVNHRCIISTFTGESVLKIGARIGISGAVIGARERIEIGSDVLIGANAVIMDCDWHDPNPLLRHTSGGSSSPVVIGDNVWIGLNAIVLKGVTIGNNSVIGANSVVTKSIPPNVIAAGNPCRVVRELKES